MHHSICNTWGLRDKIQKYHLWMHIAKTNKDEKLEIKIENIPEFDVLS